MNYLLVAILFCVSFSTHAEPTLSRIAFGSCAMQQKPQPIWDVIAKQKPDLFLLIGDAVYADFDGKKNVFPPTEATLTRDWELLANDVYFKRFRQQVPIVSERPMMA